jgi:MFS family permease
MIRLVLRVLLSGAGGYLLIALSQTLVLEILLGGRVSPEAAWTIQLAGIVGTVASGLLGGYVVARLGDPRSWLHTAPVLAVLLLDTVFVVTRDGAGNPLWFDLAGSATLMGATAAGCWIHARTPSGRSQSADR